MADWTFQCETPYGYNYSGGQLPEDDEWVDLQFTDRLRSFSWTRGKQDDLDAFEPSTATIELDDTDGYFAKRTVPIFTFGVWAERPIRIVAYDGSTAYPLWTGYIRTMDPVCNGDKPSLLRITAVDWVGWAAGIPIHDNSWDGAIAVTNPKLWWKGESSVKLLSSPETGAVYDYSANANDGVATPNDGYFEEADGIVGSGNALRIYSGSPSVSSVVSSFDLTSTDTWSVLVIWKPGSGSTSYKLVSGEIGGLLAWRIDVTGNAVRARCFNSGGTANGSATIPNTDMFVDSPDSYYAFVTFKTSATREIVVQANTIDELAADGSVGSWAAVDSGFSSVLGGGGEVQILGDTVDTIRFDDLVVWDNITVAASDFDADNGTNYTTFTGSAASMVALAEDISGRTVPANITWHTAGSDGVVYLPLASTLAEAVNHVGDAILGATWAQRNGQVRLRDFEALADSTWADEYDTPIAQFTDDPAASGSPQVIRVGRARKGPRIDRVVNEVDLSTPFGTGVRLRDEASQTIYGRRVFTKDVSGSQDRLLLAAQDVLDRYASPPVEISEVTVQPLANKDTTILDWWITEVELEKTINYREAVMVEGVSTEVVDDTFRLIRETVSWSNGRDLKLTFGLAPV